MAFNGHKIDVDVEKYWTKNHALSYQAYAIHCGCPDGFVFRKIGQISTLVEELPAPKKGFFENLKDLATKPSHSIDDANRLKLITLLDVKNFEVNNEIMEKIKNINVEDIAILAHLSKNNRHVANVQLTLYSNC